MKIFEIFLSSQNKKKEKGEGKTKEKNVSTQLLLAVLLVVIFKNIESREKKKNYRLKWRINLLG